MYLSDDQTLGTVIAKPRRGCGDLVNIMSERSSHFILTGLLHPRFARVRDDGHPATKSSHKRCWGTRNDGLIQRYLNYLFLIFTLTLVSISPLKAASHLPSNVLLRDAEIEQVLKDYLIPLFKTAGLDPNRLKILILNNSDVNAAAGLDYTILVNTGLILRANNVGQLIGVLAHETGHIAGRHNERLISTGSKAVKPMLGAMLIAAAATVATGSPAPLLLGMAGMDAVENTMLTYHRTHEASADQAAFKYMESIGWSSQGFQEFMEILHQQELFSAERQYAYKRTHPFMIERLRLLEKHLAESKYTHSAFPEKFTENFDRIRVKILAFTEPSSQVMTQFPSSNQSLIARYARAIMYHRQSRTQNALAEMDLLLKDYPNDPYFHELKGQILFETGHLEQANHEYRQAVKLLPKNSLLKIELAHVLLELPDQNHCKEVIHLLSQTERDEGTSPRIWRMYATAYGRLKQDGMVALMLAEEAAQLGDIGQAHRHADRALKILPAVDKTARQRAQDIKLVDMKKEFE